MQFLKTLFWVAIAVALVLFTVVNWHDVEVTLWGGLIAITKLPVLVIAAFLLGFLPMLVLHRARLWGLRRKQRELERQIGLLQAPVAAPPPPPPAEPAPPAALDLEDTRSAPTP